MPQLPMPDDDITENKISELEPVWDRMAEILTPQLLKMDLNVTKEQMIELKALTVRAHSVLDSLDKGQLMQVIMNIAVEHRAYFITKES